MLGQQAEAVATASPVLTLGELDLLHAWWRAANYLSVAQILRP